MKPAKARAVLWYGFQLGLINPPCTGDLHRHTDISPDGIGDGSLLDFYRYIRSI